MWKDKASREVPYDLAVVIGRFQPFHNAHRSLIQKALDVAENVLVLIGSSDIARDTKNPFTYAERAGMIMASFPDHHKHLRFERVVDQMYNDQLWYSNVQNLVDGHAEFSAKRCSVCLVGHKKDASSFYLDDLGMKWDFVTVPQIPGQIDGTALRTILFENRWASSMAEHVPEAVVNLLMGFKTSDEGIRLSEEWEFLKRYKSQFAGLKYPPIHVTADAVVFISGHVLLVKRKSHPGKGLWAFPGGFVMQNETVEQAMIRELKEETKIRPASNTDVDAIANIERSLRFTKVFDAPGRSLRGRTVTHAGLFMPKARRLPKVVGSDDADQAKWFSLAEIHDTPEMFFEDHYSIATYMLGRAD